MHGKVKYATKKGANGERMAISPKLIKQTIGLALMLYGFLVLAEPLKYATWFHYPDYFGPLGIVLTLIGVVILLRQ